MRAAPRRGAHSYHTLLRCQALPPRSIRGTLQREPRRGGNLRVGAAGRAVAQAGAGFPPELAPMRRDGNDVAWPAPAALHRTVRGWACFLTTRHHLDHFRATGSPRGSKSLTRERSPPATYNLPPAISHLSPMTYHIPLATSGGPARRDRRYEPLLSLFSYR
jgi:hypothetical protein